MKRARQFTYTFHNKYIDSFSGKGEGALASAYMGNGGGLKTVSASKLRKLTL
jgi:hypothetical protein